MDARYNSNLVRPLNSELRRGSYSDAFFAKITGKRLDQLWTEFQKTPAFTPEAAEFLKLQESLGYVNGQSPKDKDARLAAYLKEQPEGALTMDAWEFLDGLAKRSQLPEMPKRVPGEWRIPLVPGSMAKAEDYPVSRTLKFVNKGGSSIYHYTVVRTSRDSAWKLEKAWRTSPDGRIIKEYSIP